MAGLSVVLETHKDCPGKPQIVCKTSLHNHNRCSTNKLAASSFLQRCFLCHRELAKDRDIYMYRGDRAFCSEECRRRHIFMDEDAGGVSCCATTVRGSRPTGGGGGFAY